MFLKVFFVVWKLFVLLLVVNAHHVVGIHCVIASCTCSLCCYRLLIFFMFLVVGVHRIGASAS
jgi:hypothetical protein